MRLPGLAFALLRAGFTTALSLLTLCTMTGYSPAHTRTSAAETRLPLTVTVDGEVTGLVPGGTARTINYTITNPNRAPQYVSTVTVALTSITYVTSAGKGIGTTWADHPAGGAAPGCAAENFVIVVPEPIRQNLPPGRTSFPKPGVKKSSIAMVNTGSNQNDCRGTMVNLALSVG
jgi:hypothetical protein